MARSSHLKSAESSGYGYDDDHYYPSYSYYEECCPPVVDNLTYIALLSFLALATWLLHQQIQMSNLMMARRKKRQLSQFLFEGKLQTLLSDP